MLRQPENVVLNDFKQQRAAALDSQLISQYEELVTEWINTIEAIVNDTADERYAFFNPLAFELIFDSLFLVFVFFRAYRFVKSSAHPKYSSRSGISCLHTCPGQLEALATVAVTLDLTSPQIYCRESYGRMAVCCRYEQLSYCSRRPTAAVTNGKGLIHPNRLS